MKSNLDASPEEATGLGLDTGARAWERGKLNDRSIEFRSREKQRLGEQLKQILAVDPAALCGIDRVNYEVVLFALQATEVANKRYDWPR